MVRPCGSVRRVPVRSTIHISDVHDGCIVKEEDKQHSFSLSPPCLPSTNTTGTSTPSCSLQALSTRVLAAAGGDWRCVSLPRGGASDRLPAIDWLPASSEVLNQQRLRPSFCCCSPATIRSVLVVVVVFVLLLCSGGQRVAGGEWRCVPLFV